MKFFNPFFCVSAYLFSAYVTTAVVVNTNVIKDIDLTKPLITDTIRIVVTNKIEDSANDKPIDKYSYFIEPRIFDKINEIQAAEIKTGNPLKISSNGFNEKWNAYEFFVHFASPLNLGEKISIKIYTSYFEPLSPQPNEIALNEKAFFKWTGNAYVFLPYSTLKQKTVIKLPSSNIASYNNTLAPVSVKNQEITYGPYIDVLPHFKAPVTLYFHMERTQIYIERFTRKATVSHFSNVFGIDDYTNIINANPKLASFSRVEYLISNYRGGVKNAVGKLSLNIPSDAKNVYFTDMIGNISSSEISKSTKPNMKLLKLTPRFPILSGWKFSCNYGYDSSLSNFLKFDKSSNTYNLKVQAYPDPIETAIKEYELSIVLPEGAKNIKYNIPFLTESVTITKEFSFLDFSGRPKILIRKLNVDPMTLNDVVVSYTYSNLQLLVKPIIAAGLIFLIAFACSIISSFEVTLTKINAKSSKNKN
ncbi:hypothetical protein BB561_001405 [Smittium simulii]|uniref:Dolichyl-diphosphooligosaccharide--protein glycosyltransferase subunit 1 n=1 Tax=Smittium simulii TaxID=133385 RepID=A0A2T9YUU4_9FUNG|nr:hypothetical protein BB561_001405 [Smittium simulii]